MIKTTRFLHLIVTLLIVLTVFVSQANSAETRDIKYRPELGKASPALDIYAPAKARNAPVIIYVHGGAWQYGSRAQVGAKPVHFNRKGFVFVSIDYRLVPLAEVEDQLDDIDRALGWVSGNIARYGGNPKNMHLMGHSAGAHLVAMTGVKPGRTVKQLVRTGALRSVIANDTLSYDLPVIAERHGGQLFRLQRRPLGNNADRWQRLSPFHQAGARTPPFLLLYSGAGPSSFRRQLTENFAARLKSAGSNVSVYNGTRFSHRQINVQIGTNAGLTSAIDRFLKKHSQ